MILEEFKRLKITQDNTSSARKSYLITIFDDYDFANFEEIGSILVGEDYIAGFTGRMWYEYSTIEEAKKDMIRRSLDCFFARNHL